jgi:AcrR family transcriptional regulator
MIWCVARLTLNERRKAATRLEIAQIALRLFVRDGYGGVTADVIAEEAGVSLRTFYRYFSSKDEVLGPIIEERVGRFVDALADRPAEESLAVGVRRAIDLVTAQENTTASQMPVAQVFADAPALHARWLQDLRLIEQALVPVVHQRLGSSFSEEQAQVTAAVIITALRLGFERSVPDGSSKALIETLGEVLAYLRDGAGL